MVNLVWSESTDLPSTAGIGWRCLESKKKRIGRWASLCSLFVVKLDSNETVLDCRCAQVRCQARKMKVVEAQKATHRIRRSSQLSRGLRKSNAASTFSQ